jgi:hypothetical protein
MPITPYPATPYADFAGQKKVEKRSPLDIWFGYDVCRPPFGGTQRWFFDNDIRDRDGREPSQRRPLHAGTHQTRSIGTNEKRAAYQPTHTASLRGTPWLRHGGTGDFRDCTDRLKDVGGSANVIPSDIIRRRLQRRYGRMTAPRNGAGWELHPVCVL